MQLCPHPAGKPDPIAECWRCRDAGWPASRRGCWPEGWLASPRRKPAARPEPRFAFSHHGSASDAQVPAVCQLNARRLAGRLAVWLAVWPFSGLCPLA